MSRDPAERVVPLLAHASRQAGERLVVVSSDTAQLDLIDKGLWEQSGEAFLAHGRAGEPHEERQPALLSDGVTATNGARYVILADGRWRDGAEDFERVFFLFNDEALQRARECWRMLDGRDGLERNFWKQDGGKWNKQA